MKKYSEFTPKEKIALLKEFVIRNESKISHLKKELTKRIKLAEREKLEIRLAKQTEMRKSRLKRIYELELELK